MQRLVVSGAVRPIYGSLGVKRLKTYCAKGYITITFHSNIISQCMGIITCLQVWEKGDPFWERSYINQWSKSQVAVYARRGYKSQ